jgi:hypothetical protein
MTRHVLAAAALTIATSFGQTPIPPQKPVIVLTEIGEVAGSRNKIQVLVSSQVEPKKITGAIQIKDKGMMGGRFEIDSASAPELAKLLDEAASKLIAGEMFSGKVGAANVSVAELNGQKGVVLKFDRTGPSLSIDTLMLDSDNAAGLARIISRAKQVADWIMPKLATLQQ